MDPDLSALEAHLEDVGADGYLLDAGADSSDQLYLSGFDAPDPFVTVYTPERLSLLVSGLEYGRATVESRADEVCRLADYDYRDLQEEHGREEARKRVVAAFLRDRDVDAVSVPARFPVGTADGLRERGIDVTAEYDGVVTGVRARKTDEEIEHVRAAQRANEAAMAAAEDLLATAAVEDGVLTHDGEALTSERVKLEIERTLLERGCALSETIVASGADGADPHDRGSGPIEEGELVVIDIFPRDSTTKYHADMTRTFVVGEPTDEQRRRFEVTREAVDAAMAAVEPGATGAAVHDAVCDVYEDAGFATQRSDPTTETGFIHSTGHGVGLDVHEQPSVGPGGEELEPGHVITVEPGLYDPDVGGLRLEDLVVVREDGHENLTDYPTRLQPVEGA